MKKLVYSLILLWIASSCDKPEPLKPPSEEHPKMKYMNLADISVIFGRGAFLDVDQDGTKDILFSTQLVGDPINQVDKMQWFVTSSFDTNLPVNDDENVPMMNYGDSIAVNNFPGYHWYNASTVVLTQKIISNNIPPYWEGGWKQASHRYLPIQVKKNNQLFNGWIELSFNAPGEKIVLHKTAITIESNKTIIAGK